MAKKRKKQTNKEKRLQRKEAREAAEVADQQNARRRKALLALVIVLTAGGVAAVYFTDGSRSLMGMILLVGSGLGLMVGLGGLGGSVQPKDRRKAGSIDYGN